MFLIVSEDNGALSEGNKIYQFLAKQRTLAGRINSLYVGVFKGFVDNERYKVGRLSRLVPAGDGLVS